MQKKASRAFSWHGHTARMRVVETGWVVRVTGFDLSDPTLGRKEVQVGPFESRGCAYFEVLNMLRMSVVVSAYVVTADGEIVHVT